AGPLRVAETEECRGHDVDAVPGSDHDGVGHAIGDADTGREQAITGADAEAAGIVAITAKSDQIRLWIPVLNAGVMSAKAVHHGILLPAQAVGDGELLIDLPTVANIKTELPIDGVLLLPLHTLFPVLDDSEQIGGPVVVLRGAGSPGSV